MNIYEAVVAANRCICLLRSSGAAPLPPAGATRRETERARKLCPRWCKRICHTAELRRWAEFSWNYFITFRDV